MFQCKRGNSRTTYKKIIIFAPQGMLKNEFEFLFKEQFSMQELKFDFMGKGFFRAIDTKLKLMNEAKIGERKQKTEAKYIFKT